MKRVIRFLFRNHSGWKSPEMAIQINSQRLFEPNTIKLFTAYILKEQNLFVECLSYQTHYSFRETVSTGSFTAKAFFYCVTLFTRAKFQCKHLLALKFKAECRILELLKQSHLLLKGTYYFYVRKKQVLFDIQLKNCIFYDCQIPFVMNVFHRNMKVVLIWCARLNTSVCSGYVTYLPISEWNIPLRLAFYLKHRCEKEEEADKRSAEGPHGGCIAII